MTPKNANTRALLLLLMLAFGHGLRPAERRSKIHRVAVGERRRASSAAPYPRQTSVPARGSGAGDGGWLEDYRGLLGDAEGPPDKGGRRRKRPRVVTSAEPPSRPTKSFLSSLLGSFLPSFESPQGKAKGRQPPPPPPPPRGGGHPSVRRNGNGRRRPPPGFHDVRSGYAQVAAAKPGTHRKKAGGGGAGAERVPLLPGGGGKAKTGGAGLAELDVITAPTVEEETALERSDTGEIADPPLHFKTGV